MGDLAGVLASLYGGQQQGNAANEMKSWLQGQQAKIDNLYNPGTAEYNSLWDEMSRKDAAAGRNSQYGPRSVDLAAKLAGIKGDLTTRFTTGTSRAYADALNQYGNRNAGLAGSLGKLLGGAGGASSILSGLSGLSGLFGNNNFDFSGGQSMITPSNMSNQEIDDFINGMSFGTDPAFEDPWTDIFSEWY